MGRSLVFQLQRPLADNGDYLDVVRNNMLRMAQNPAGGGVL